MTRIKMSVLLLGVLTVVAAGCQRGSEFAPVEGTITKDGKPLDGMIVEFYPDGDTPLPRSASDLTDPEGHYRLQSVRNGENGAVVGTHRVCIRDLRNVPKRKSFVRPPEGTANAENVRKEMPPPKEASSAPPRVPPVYGRFDETPLRIEVHSGSQVIDFDVKGASIEVK